MGGLSENIAGRAVFHHFASVHHVYSVRDVIDHAKIVAHEQHAHPQLCTEPEQQVEYLLLNRDVKRGCRLVGDQ